MLLPLRLMPARTWDMKIVFFFLTDESSPLRNFKMTGKYKKWPIWQNSHISWAWDWLRDETKASGWPEDQLMSHHIHKNLKVLSLLRHCRLKPQIQSLLPSPSSGEGWKRASPCGKSLLPCPYNFSLYLKGSSFAFFSNYIVNPSPGNHSYFRRTYQQLPHWPYKTRVDHYLFLQVPVMRNGWLTHKDLSHTKI